MGAVFSGEWDEQKLVLIIIFFNNVERRIKIENYENFSEAHSLIDDFESYLSSPSSSKVGKLKLHDNGNLVLDYSKVASIELEVTELK
ncbi:TPA: hypothetical protein I7245_21655 [Vibrio vulnificus]|uniref:hypothetical protein n=1 Tax=Vibrio vulnificus TaxID=672 RepID=UPI001A19884B|nr:hypothetical protein [Vibrio vulnificus]WHE21907.1 hypothetical protein PVE41_01730 [Vibrio vulnificus]HAS6208563.1 hypothetical protein [Vibrio vulnificus]HAS6331932.1 hypothetical protein [Vibrio vulnificus]HAS6336598.1 hypothetical protein [Vibrio vulnificus]HAS8613766.1 hypothetical protein [Vibrio vulnificus]